MEIKEVSIAGTLESSDILVRIEPKEQVGIEIELKSSVEKQFGRQIRKVINTTLETMGVKSAKVIATDKGALDCVIKARVECAAFRAAGVTQNINWEVIG
jgi:citrate lyase subunit gamma (acyl carrier protein)